MSRVIVIIQELPTLLIIFISKEAISAIAFLRGLAEDNELVIKEIESMKNEDLYIKSLPNVNFCSICKFMQTFITHNYYIYIIYNNYVTI